MSNPLILKRVPATQKLEELDYAPNSVVIYDDLTPAPVEAPVIATAPHGVSEALAAIRTISNPATVTTATLAKRFNQLIEALQE